MERAFDAYILTVSVSRPWSDLQSIRPAKTLDRFVRWSASQVQGGTIVLDCGAGECQYKKYFDHARYVGVDFAAGDKSWDYSQLDVIADVHHLPFAASVFGAVICTEVLEHVPAPQAVLREIARVGCPGAIIYVTTPFLVGGHQEPHDYYRYTRFGLQKLAADAGLEVVDIQPGGGFFILLAILLDRVPNYVFPSSLRGWRRTLTLPLKAALRVFFTAIPALIVPHLDRLDKDRTHTRCYYTVLRVPETDRAPGR
jgi:SAM-dependent methyltransferase